MALAHAILATLMDCPLSGYDLRKRFEISVGFFWQASFQQIYRELSKMEQDQLVTSETIEQQGRPDKKIFAMTAAGKEFLQDWIQKPCGMPPLRDDLLVKMFAGFVVPRETFLLELEAHRSQHEERLAVYQQIQQNQFANVAEIPNENLFRYLTLRNGIRLETEWLAWSEEAVALLKSQ